MHTGDERADTRQGWGRLRTVLVLLLGLTAIAGCSSSADDDSGSFEPGWIYGGQTGSLMPTCGVALSTITSGVPASAEGFVLDTSACEGDVLANLVVRDGEGRAIDVQLQPLGSGAVFVRVGQGLVPGVYVVGGAPRAVELDDAGLDDDAGAPSEGPAASTDGSEPGQSVQVEAAAPAPTELGELTQVGGGCSAGFELQLDAGVLPYVATLALDVAIDGSAPRPLIEFGRLDVSDGVARIELTAEMLDSLWTGDHELAVFARVAGMQVAIEPALAMLRVPCSEATPQRETLPSSACSVRAPGRRADVPGTLASVLGLAWLAAVMRCGRTRKRMRRDTRS